MSKQKNQTISLMLTGSLALSIAMNQQANARPIEGDKNKVSRSTDLVVDPSFNFETSRTVSLDIAVTDDLNQPMVGVMVKVFALEDPSRLGNIKRALKSTLITVARTNSEGKVVREVEIPQHYRDLKIEKQTMSANPIKILSVQGQQHISVSL